MTRASPRISCRLGQAAGAALLLAGAAATPALGFTQQPGASPPDGAATIRYSYSSTLFNVTVRKSGSPPPAPQPAPDLQARHGGLRGWLDDVTDALFGR